MNADSILTFWFVECRPWQWFRRSDHFDALVRQRFGDLVIRALAGELEHWSTEPGSSLALVLLLDQFSRQLWRDQPRAFSGDPQALRLSRLGLQRGWIAAEPEQPRRQFWLMPHLHSEDATVVRHPFPFWNGMWTRPPWPLPAAIWPSWSSSGVTRGATRPLAASATRQKTPI